jgi:hypothetical protein
MIVMMIVLSNNKELKEIKSIVIAKIEEQPSYQKEFAFVIFTENGKKHIVNAVTYSNLNIGQIYQYQEKENLTFNGKIILLLLSILLITVFTIQILDFYFVE